MVLEGPRSQALPWRDVIACVMIKCDEFRWLQSKWEKITADQLNEHASDPASELWLAFRDNRVELLANRL